MVKKGGGKKATSKQKRKELEKRKEERRIRDRRAIHEATVAQDPRVSAETRGTSHPDFSKTEISERAERHMAKLEEQKPTQEAEQPQTEERDSSLIDTGLEELNKERELDQGAAFSGEARPITAEDIYTITPTKLGMGLLALAAKPVLRKVPPLLATRAARAATIKADLKAFKNTAVNKAAQVGKKLPETTKAIPVYLTNPKSMQQTLTLLGKIGLGVSIGALFVGAVGSYPFAGFIKEEAIQQLTISAEKALAANDIEGAEAAADNIEAILEPEIMHSILASIPYVNVVTELKGFFKATGTSLDNLRERIQRVRDETPTLFQEQQAERDAERDAKFNNEKEKIFVG